MAEESHKEQLVKRSSKWVVLKVSGRLEKHPLHYLMMM
jgi:hypothetical protein